MHVVQPPIQVLGVVECRIRREKQAQNRRDERDDGGSLGTTGKHRGTVTQGEQTAENPPQLRFGVRSLPTSPVPAGGRAPPSGAAKLRGSAGTSIDRSAATR